MCLPGTPEASSFTLALSHVQVREFIQPLGIPVWFLHTMLSCSFYCLLRSKDLSLPPTSPRWMSKLLGLWLVFSFTLLLCLILKKKLCLRPPDNLMSKNSIKIKIYLQSANFIIQKRLCDVVPNTHPGLSRRSLLTILTLAAGSFFTFH